MSFGQIKEHEARFCQAATALSKSKSKSNVTVKSESAAKRHGSVKVQQSSLSQRALGTFMSKYMRQLMRRSEIKRYG